MSVPTLLGVFVDLRPLVAGDAEATLRWRQSERARLLNRGAATVEQQAAWIAGRPASEHNFIITLKDGRAVGALSLVGIDAGNRHAESARFLIGEEAAVRGIPAAVEAMKLLYQHAFDTLGLTRIFGTIAAGNKRMITWQKFLGMREEGRMRRHYLLNGAYQDAVMLGLLEDEYRNDALPRMDAMIRMGEQAPVATPAKTDVETDQ